MKKLFIIILIIVLSLSGCGNKKENKNNYKIAIITADAAESEAIFEAERLAKDKKHIVRAVYDSDNPNESAEKLCLDYSKDKNIRAIVFVKGFSGLQDIILKIKEKRNDILFICGSETENAVLLSDAADISMATDLYNNGTQMIDKAYEMGAKRMIYYTFARHLLIEPMFRRREIMIKRCEELGMEFIDITCPDPQSAVGGVEETQSFIKEDVSSKVGDYGTDTAFYCTENTANEALIEAVINNKAILPQQSCPNPFHGYASYFGIDVGKYDDTQGVLNKISDGIKNSGNSGRMSTWSVSVDMLIVNAGVKYAIEYCIGTINDNSLRSVIESSSGGKCSFSKFGGRDNCILLLPEYFTF